MLASPAQIAAAGDQARHSMTRVHGQSDRPESRRVAMVKRRPWPFLAVLTSPRPTAA